LPEKRSGCGWLRLVLDEEIVLYSNDEEKTKCNVLANTSLYPVKDKQAAGFSVFVYA
jgi:hypothetical protein